jgi:hypothetical protein
VIGGDRATEASGARVRNDDASIAASAAVGERGPLAEEDSANECRGHERRDNRATNQMGMLCTR